MYRSAIIANPATPIYDWSGDEARWSQEQKLASLHPEFREKIIKVLGEMRARGFDPYIHFGWRDLATQTRLKEQGFTKVSFSFHNATDIDGHPAALAVDIPSKSKGWEPGQTYWNTLGEIGEKHGLTWGGRWSDPWDPSHLQGAENNQLKTLKTAGLSAIGYASRVTGVPIKWGLVVYSTVVSIGALGLFYLIWRQRHQR